LAFVGIAIIIVLIISFINQAEQGPLAIFFIGPSALAIGILIGTFIWLLAPKKS
jgi:hypothetical protein